jgi:lipopolysaccharide biosynthesis glycosyltransferase
MLETVTDDDTITVCTALDAGYLPLVLVVATSIAASAAPGRRVAFHILYDGPDNWAVRRVQRWRHPQVEIVLHRLANPYVHFGTIGGFPPSTLFRFAVPDVLAHLDRVIYLDCDLIVEADLGDLFHTPLDGKPIGAVVDIRFVDRALTTHPDRQRLRDDAHDYLTRVLRFDTDEAMLTYIQAGVALLDLHQLRHIGYAARMTETVRRLRDELRFADQCATNTAFRGNITILDPRWNVFPEALPDGEWDDVIPELRPAFAAQRRDPRIIHFAYLKPWRRKGLPASDRWWRHAYGAGLGPHYAWQFIATRGSTKLNALRRRLGHRR